MPDINILLRRQSMAFMSGSGTKYFFGDNLVLNEAVPNRPDGYWFVAAQSLGNHFCCLEVSRGAPHCVVHCTQAKHLLYDDTIQLSLTSSYCDL